MTSTIREKKRQALFKPSSLNPRRPQLPVGRTPFLKACYTFLSFKELSATRQGWEVLNVGCGPGRLMAVASFLLQNPLLTT